MLHIVNLETHENQWAYLLLQLLAAAEATDAIVLTGADSNQATRFYNEANKTIQCLSWYRLLDSLVDTSSSTAIKTIHSEDLVDIVCDHNAPVITWF